ncbi:probable disease resistance protein At1g61310 [Tripterygium wilfordii]|uniref:probable disease resistance protein At1g61310 n=1 Tax=Tripterygium wilfordii TaxID=458696 RepID=UPI0018F7FFF6|nr:probable disease resistance protein At1g61310 [Tripterygium wilfordii]
MELFYLCGNWVSTVVLKPALDSSSGKHSFPICVLTSLSGCFLVLPVISSTMHLIHKLEMVDIVILIASKVADCLLDPIIAHLNYITSYNKNVQKLRKETENLRVMKENVELSVGAAERSGEVITPTVVQWLSRVDKIIEAAQKMGDETKLKEKCLFGWCPNCIHRYNFSVKSAKKMSVIASLEKDGNFKRVSHLPPPGEFENLCHGEAKLFESRKPVLDQIVDVLKDESIDVVVLSGVEGIGKTTLAKEAAKKAKEMQLFDHVIMALVSKNVNLREIQDQIADMLGLKFTEGSNYGRARRLSSRIKSENKILIILDDVSKSLDLESVGIPYGDNLGDGKVCKILVTTPNERISNTFGRNSKKISVGDLPEEESWSLFRSVAGDMVDSPAIKGVANDIVGECRGLPLMLETIGKRLRDKEVEEWRDLLLQLRRFRAENKDEGSLHRFLKELE